MRKKYILTRTIELTVGVDKIFASINNWLIATPRNPKTITIIH